MELAEIGRCRALFFTAASEAVRFPLETGDRRKVRDSQNSACESVQRVEPSRRQPSHFSPTHLDLENNFKSLPFEIKGAPQKRHPFF